MIPQYKERIKETDEKIKDLKQQLNSLYNIKEKLFKNIQDECSHPKEYQNVIITNSNRDPLEAARYIIKCTICEKTLKMYDMIREQKHEVKTY